MNEISDYMTVKCPICGRPYVFYSTMSGDQSACPACRERAVLNEQNIEYNRTSYNPRKFNSTAIS